MGHFRRYLFENLWITSGVSTTPEPCLMPTRKATRDCYAMSDMDRAKFTFVCVPLKRKSSAPILGEHKDGAHVEVPTEEKKPKRDEEPARVTENPLTIDSQDMVFNPIDRDDDYGLEETERKEEDGYDADGEPDGEEEDEEADEEEVEEDKGDEQADEAHKEDDEDVEEDDEEEDKEEVEDDEEEQSPHEIEIVTLSSDTEKEDEEN